MHVFIRLVSWYIRFRIGLSVEIKFSYRWPLDLYFFVYMLVILVRFHTEYIVIIRFRVDYLCFQMDLWHAACFRTAGLLISMFSNMFASWNYVFVQTASLLILFRIGFKIFVRFRREGIVIIRFLIQYLCFRTRLWRVACFRIPGSPTCTL